MADDVTLPGTGARIASDDDGTRQYQWTKLVWGPDDTFNKVDITSGKPLPTQLRDSAGASLTDANGVKITAGTQTIGKVGLNDGTNALVFVQDVPGTNAFALPVIIHPDSATGTNGDVANDAVDSGNPVKIGGQARSSEATPVSANADRVNAVFDLVGKQIVLPYANPENFVSGAITTAMTGTSDTSLLASPGAGLRNYITQITVSNSHATVGTDINIKDGSTTIYVIPAAAVYGGAVLTFPTPLRQPTTATAINAANVTTGSSTKVSASGYKGV